MFVSTNFTRSKQFSFFRFASQLSQRCAQPLLIAFNSKLLLLPESLSTSQLLQYRTTAAGAGTAGAAVATETAGAAKTAELKNVSDIPGPVQLPFIGKEDRLIFLIVLECY